MPSIKSKRSETIDANQHFDETIKEMEKYAKSVEITNSKDSNINSNKNSIYKNSSHNNSISKKSSENKNPLSLTTINRDTEAEETKEQNKISAFSIALQSKLKCSAREEGDFTLG